MPARRKHPKVIEPVAMAAYTIKQFCEAYGGISTDFYFKLQRQGRGPKTMKLGTRTLITVKSAEAWAREREAKSAQATEHTHAQAAEHAT
jgi:hypothetical protein